MALPVAAKVIGLAGVATVGLELLALRNLMKEEKDKLTPEQKTKINKKIAKLKEKVTPSKGKTFAQQASKQTKKPEGKAETRFSKGGMVKKTRKKK